MELKYLNCAADLVTQMPFVYIQGKIISLQPLKLKCHFLERYSIRYTRCIQTTGMRVQNWWANKLSKVLINGNNSFESAGKFAASNIEEIKTGENIAKEINKGVTILKWNNKRDILLLSSKLLSEMLNVESIKTQLEITNCSRV